MKKITIFICLLLTSSFYAVASTQTGKVVKVPHHKSTHVNLAGKAKRVSLGDPEVLDFVMLRSNELFLIGKKLGSTNLMAWDYRGRLIEAINIEVTHDLNSLKAKLHEFLPDEKIEVHSSQNRLILSGMVSSQSNMNVALRVAETYAAGESVEATAKGGAGVAAGTQSLSENVQKSGIINLMTVGGSQQVMLEVTVAEVQRSLIRKFDANIAFFNTGDHFGAGIASTASSISGITPSLGPPTVDASDYGILGGFVDSRNTLSLALDMAKEQGAAKILAEPNLTALSGSKAEMLAGGEFPIPVSQDNNTVTIEYKEYGVGLKFIPTILSNQNINLEMAVDVSEITTSSSLSIDVIADASYQIYPITRRSASSTLELADGQTIGIAGLLSENVKDAARKFPGLGDLPILGQLFNSSAYIKGETELVILVTARLAKAVDRDNIVLPTDLFMEPTDMQYYLLGKSPYVAAYSASPETAAATEGPATDFVEYPDGGTEGTFGHSF